jgi:hypothetical protein
MTEIVADRFYGMSAQLSKCHLSFPKYPAIMADVKDFP